MTSTAAIEIDNLGKRFGTVTAVEALSFTVGAGEIFGFMGHNGAGKTTTLRMLLGLTTPSTGAARVLGHDCTHAALEVRRVTGFLPASYTLPPDMTARGFLHYIAAMFELPVAVARQRTEALLARFGLQDAADRRLRGFSTGMAQKVGLAQALVNEPRVLLLDEPTSGLDPLGRHELLELLRELARDRGVTVLFSSHILSDVEAVCQRVAALHHGKLIACDTVAALKAEHGGAGMDDLYLSLVRSAAA
ncbi:MAG: ABC transporter ATP-binding protein [Deltaproteobacteria bacterium]|nr:ABC transporter ATP-binding protein [Deltaproteobacteria bacterium]